MAPRDLVHTMIGADLDSAERAARHRLSDVEAFVAEMRRALDDRTHESSATAPAECVRAMAEAHTAVRATLQLRRVLVVIDALPDGGERG